MDKKKTETELEKITDADADMQVFGKGTERKAGQLVLDDISLSAEADHHIRTGFGYCRPEVTISKIPTSTLDFMDLTFDPIYLPKDMAHRYILGDTTVIMSYGWSQTGKADDGNHEYLDMFLSIFYGECYALRLGDDIIPIDHVSGFCFTELNVSGQDPGLCKKLHDKLSDKLRIIPMKKRRKTDRIESPTGSDDAGLFLYLIKGNS